MKSRVFGSPFGVSVVGLCGLLAAGCAASGAGARAYPELVPFEGREVRDVEFTGNAPFGRDTLERVTETRATHCRLLGIPVCLFGFGRRVERLDLGNLNEDVRRLTVFYRQSGFFGTIVRPEVRPVDSDPDGESPVAVTFHIDRADPVVLESLVIEGVEPTLDIEELRRALPLREGKRFELGDLVAAADTVERRLRSEGHAYAEVLRNFDVDTVANVAAVELLAIPGPLVRVDSILIVGADRLGRREVLRQLPFAEGDLLRQTELNEGQRNLFSLDIVQFAAVSVAEDSLQVDPDDRSLATILVQVTEGPVHVVEAAAGYGTVTCFRTRTSWVSRSFMGGARRLAVGGRLSKIGIGSPLDMGFIENICPAFREQFFGEETFQDELDYQLEADFTRPYFFSPRNHVALSGFLERLSEPRVFQREARGGRFAVNRRLGTGDAGTATLSAERVRFDASPSIFCLALAVCRRADIDILLSPRWRNALGLRWSRDRTDNPLEPTEGYQLRATTTNASPLLASQLHFTRFVGDGAAYVEVRPDWVLAGRARLGTFFGTAIVNPPPEDVGRSNVLPPDERFYVGGANTVRGFEQNGMGPGVFVTELAPEGDELLPQGDTVFVPVGGTDMAVVNLELRFPSPVLTRRVRLAAFVDAGTLGAEGPGEFTRHWRFTPGVGVRIQSPVGPIRADVAVQPHGARRGPLFLIDRVGGELVRAEDRIELKPGLLERLQLHIAVGHPF